jgi:phage recombination protein Bet
LETEMSAQQNEVAVITRSEVAQAEQRRVSLVEKMADKYHLDPRNMMATLKATAFKGEVSNEQMAALMIVADQHNLNPWLKEIYAFPSRQGIVPIVGVDGWARIINEHKEFDGMEFVLSGETGKEAYTCTIHRKDRAHPVTVTEYMTECYRATDPWKSHPLRMLRHKAMIQCARLAFSFAGIYDPDEGERVLAAEEAIDVTPAKPTLQLDAEGKPQFVNADGTEHVPGKKIGPKRMRAIVEKVEAAGKAQDGPGLLEVLDELDNDEKQQVYQQIRSWDRTVLKELERTAREAAGPAPHLAPWSLELLGACENVTALTAAWTAIQGAYDANGTTPPGDIETVYIDRKKELTQ